MPCLHPIDALIRRVQKNSIHPNRRLDAQIARVLHGAEMIYERDGEWWRICSDKRQINKRRVPHYCACRTAQMRACHLLRRKKAGLPLTNNRQRPALQRAA